MTDELSVFSGVPFLMQEDGLRQNIAIAGRKLSDPALAAQLKAAREFQPEALAMKGFQRLAGTRGVMVRDGVATVGVIGPIVRYASIFSEISGATSLDVLARDFQAAVDDPNVVAILIHFDSPGGEARGIAEFAATIRAATEKKPVLAYGGDLVASGALWLAASTREIVLSSTAIIGSVGAVAVIADTRQRDAMAGVRNFTVVSSTSPRKGLHPASDEGQAEIRDVLDAIAERFVADLATYRGVTTEKVLADFGQGGVVARPADAIARGMADRIGSFEGLLAELASGKMPAPRTSSSPQSNMEHSNMETIRNSNNQAPIESRAKAAWDASLSLRDEFAGDFAAYLAFAKADEAGLVKMYSGRRGDAA